MSNYGVAGPSTSSGNNDGGMFECYEPNRVIAYHFGNIWDGNRNATLDGTAVTGVSGDFDSRATAFSVPEVTTQPASDAAELVARLAGARPYNRDAVDRRVVNDLSNGTGAIVNTVADAGGYPTIRPGTVVADLDRDGMPDGFERDYGTNPNVADNNGDIDGDGYTNLENYLHWAGRYAR